MRKSKKKIYIIIHSLSECLSRFIVILNIFHIFTNFSYSAIFPVFKPKGELAAEGRHLASVT